MRAIAEYERTLSSHLLDAVEGIAGLTVHGVTDRASLRLRVPTLCFSVAGVASSAIADAMAARDIGIRSGHMYSPRLMQKLGLMPAGVVRASLAHYNTVPEIARFKDELADVIRKLR
jgi:selenocysteine lyase/cysteine desulfurase